MAAIGFAPPPLDICRRVRAAHSDRSLSDRDSDGARPRGLSKSFGSNVYSDALQRFGLVAALLRRKMAPHPVSRHGRCLRRVGKNRQYLRRRSHLSRTIRPSPRPGRRGAAFRSLQAAEFRPGGRISVDLQCPASLGVSQLPSGPLSCCHRFCRLDFDDQVAALAQINSPPPLRLSCISVMWWRSAPMA
jgi:hypothetical protein